MADTLNTTRLARENFLRNEALIGLNRDWDDLTDEDRERWEKEAQASPTILYLCDDCSTPSACRFDNFCMQHISEQVSAVHDVEDAGNG